MKFKLVALILLLQYPTLQAQHWVYCLASPTDTTNFNWYGDISKHGREGKWLAINEGTQLRIYSEYSKGVLNGSWLLRYRSGKIKEQGQFENGSREGVWIKFYENGDTFNYCFYKRGALEGSYRQYHLGNNMACVGTFVQGRKHGKWVDYFSYRRTEGPFITTTYTYVNDTIDGIVRRTDQEKITVFTYKMGQIISISESTIPKHESNVVEDNSIYRGAGYVTAQQNHVRYNFPYLGVEYPPEFPGGEDKLKAYLRDTVTFGLNGNSPTSSTTVSVVFTVEKDGSISNVYAQDATQNSEAERAEAVQLISAMPKWKPALYSQEPVPCLMIKYVTLIPK